MNISIVTISYNQKEYLLDCLQSVSTQLKPGDQHVVVDPGSQDDSRVLINEYTERVDGAMAVFEKDRGPAEGLNNGFKRAGCDIQAYINADDFILPGTLDYVRAFFSSHPETDVLIGAIKIADAQGKIKKRGRVADHPSRIRIANDRFQYYQQGTFFRREAFAAVGGFNQANRTCWDRELIVDMLLFGKKINVCSKPLGAFRLHAASITGSGANTANYSADVLRIRGKFEKTGMETTNLLISKFLKFEAHCNPIRIFRQYRPIA